MSMMGKIKCTEKDQPSSRADVLAFMMECFLNARKRICSCNASSHMENLISTTNVGTEEALAEILKFFHCCQEYVGL